MTNRVLEKADLDGAIESMYADTHYGETEDERRRNIAAWRQIAQYWGLSGLALTIAPFIQTLIWPPTWNWLWFIAAMFPALTYLGGFVTHKRLWVLSTDNAIDSSAINCGGLSLLPLGFLSLRFNYLDERLWETWLALLGIPCAILVFIGAWNWFERGNRHAFKYAGYAILIGGAYGAILVGLINVGLDHQPSLEKILRVDAKDISRPSNSWPSYYVEVTDPATEASFGRVRISPGQYANLQEGDLLKITVRPGRLGIPWAPGPLL